MHWLCSAGTVIHFGSGILQDLRPVEMRIQSIAYGFVWQDYRHTVMDKCDILCQKMTLVPQPQLRAVRLSPIAAAANAVAATVEEMLMLLLCEDKSRCCVILFTQ